MSWVQGCLYCGWSGIDEANSYPAEGPSYYSMGEPPVIVPCICQYGDAILEGSLTAWDWAILRRAFPDEI